MPKPPQPTPEQFDQIAKAIDPGASVVGTRTLLGGLGCQMDVLEMRLGDGTVQKVVVRQYWIHKNPIEDERPISESHILKVMDENDIPAPLPVLDENVASKIFGRPSVVISYIDGSPNLDPADPHDWARQLAATLAGMHAIKVPTEFEFLQGSRNSRTSKWMSAGEPPEKFTKHELGKDLWTAMRSLWPDVDTSASQIVHGDFWPGNTLWNDDKLAAIVDWDGPSLGVPAKDVAYFLTDLAYIGLDVEETFLETYERSSGQRVQDLLFWKMVATATPLPDVGPWAQGYSEMGLRKMTPERIRHAHADYIKNLLKEFHDSA